MSIENVDVCTSVYIPEADGSATTPACERVSIGLKATLLTELLCPMNVRICLPVFASHRRIVPSQLPLASI